MKTVTFTKEKKIYKYNKEFEFTKNIVKFILKNRGLKAPIRWYIQFKFQKKQKRATLARIKNKCLLRRRSRGFYRFAKMSRLFLKDNNFISRIPGLQQAKW